MFGLPNLQVVDPKLSDAFKDICRLRAIRRVPRPAFLNQIPVNIEDILGARGSGFVRQLDGNLTRISLLFPWLIPRDNLGQ